MDVALTRDWIIIILGILEILLVIVFFIIFIVLYKKINALINKGKATVMKIEHAVATPYLKAGSHIFKIIATVLGMLQKRQAKEE